MNSKLTCIFDWIEFTIHNMKPDDIILQVLQLKHADFMELPKGRYGYKKQKVSGHISVLYDGMEDMGVHVLLSGQGCREYEAVRDLLKLLDKIMLYDGKCTRIDMAMDDKTGEVIPFERIRDAIIQGYVSSRWKTSTEYVKRQLLDGEIIGHTINIGSRKSKMFMRIYDKAMEQGGRMDPTGNGSDSWIRIEMEIRDSRAEKLQDILLFNTNVGQVYAQIINNYIRFLQPTNDSNRSRWPTAAWWTSLIQEVERLSLTRQPEDRTVEDVRDWVKQQIGPSLALLVLADGGSYDDILDTIVAGKARLKEKHFRMLSGKKASEPCPEGFEPI